MSRTRLLVTRIALLAALAAFVSGAAGASVNGRSGVGGGVRTLLSLKGPVYAFAQDRDEIVWETSDPGCGQTVRMRKVAAGSTVHTLTTPGGATCDGGEIDYWAPLLAVAGASALWETGLAALTYVDVDVYVGSPGTKDRMVDIEETSYGQNESPPDFDGLIVPIVGQGSMLAYAPGQVWRIVNRKPVRVAGLRGATVLAADGSRLAVAETLSAHQAQVVVQGGATIAGLSPTAIALSGNTMAALAGGAIKLYDAASGRLQRTVRVPAATLPSVSLSGEKLVFAVRHERHSAIELLDTRTGSLSMLAVVPGSPLGLSIVDHRVAWGENSGRRGWIKAIQLG